MLHIYVALEPPVSPSPDGCMRFNLADVHALTLILCDEHNTTHTKYLLIGFPILLRRRSEKRLRASCKTRIYELFEVCRGYNVIYSHFMCANRKRQAKGRRKRTGGKTILRKTCLLGT